jgi:predicted NACHT family NTPase
MEPLSFAAILTPEVLKTVAENLAADYAKTGFKTLVSRLKPGDRENNARRAIELFTDEFLKEIEDKFPASSMPGFKDQLKRLIETAAPQIVAWLEPETTWVDLRPVERLWSGLGLAPLPDFDWPLVARNYARAIRREVKNNPLLREVLNTAFAEQSASSIARLAGLDPGFDLTGYRKYLCDKCSLLQLSALHTSAYHRQVMLWSVFVPQMARESVPDIPRNILRHLHQEGHLENDMSQVRLPLMKESYASSPPMSILEILKRDRLVVVLGDPGSGKTSLLKSLVMGWASPEASVADNPKLPLWIDLREYARVRGEGGLLKFCETGCATFGLNAAEAQKRLMDGEAAVYLDALDEILDRPTRGSVVEEIAAFAAHHANAQVVVTSRSFGYEPDRLRNSNFTHATLEDFDDPQITDFLGKWHLAAESDPAERTRLQQQLSSAFAESRPVRDLAGNPLLLTMMAILNKNQPLPRDRVGLYREASRVLLNEWDARKLLPVDTFARQEKEELLCELAGAMQQAEENLAGNLIERDRVLQIFRDFLRERGLPDFYAKAHALVQQLTERNFILCYAGADRFSFVHRTFLEYFCASWFVDQFQKKQTLSLAQMKTDVFGRHWRDETWHEVLRLIAGMIGEKHAEQLVLYLMEQDGRNNKLANMMLAANCLSEVRNRQTIRATSKRLLECFINDVVRFDTPYYYRRDELWSEVGPTRRKAVSLLASTWRSTETHNWMKSAAIADEDWIVRLSVVQELARGWKGDPETLLLLRERARSDPHYAVRLAAIRELTGNWNDDAVPLLCERGGSDEHAEVRIAASKQLARGWKSHPDTRAHLQKSARSDLNEAVRRAAIYELTHGWKDDPDTLTILQEHARFDEHFVARSAAVQWLARGWKNHPDTLPILKERTRSDSHYDVRFMAIQELQRGWKDDPEVVEIIADWNWKSDRSEI